MTTERSSMSRSLYKNRDLEKLEPYEGKPSRTVLRGEEGSNALDLPDRPADMEQRNGRAVRKGNTDLLNKAKLDNKIMQLEKELAIFKKERGRAERKIAQNGQDIEKVASAVRRMEDDLEYIASYTGDKIVSLLSTGEDTAEKTGRELHRIAKTYRNRAYTVIDSYMGLDLLVKSEYNLDGSFDRNTFFVEGKSGLKYRYGISGALPLGFADTALYPQATLDKLPSVIKQQRERMAKLESELPTLQAIVSRTWGRQGELDTLKKECGTLKERIDESLKENRPEQEETETAPMHDRRATDYAA